MLCITRLSRDPWEHPAIEIVSELSLAVVQQGSRLGCVLVTHLVELVDKGGRRWLVDFLAVHGVEVTMLVWVVVVNLLLVVVVPLLLLVVLVVVMVEMRMGRGVVA